MKNVVLIGMMAMVSLCAFGAEKKAAAPTTEGTAPSSPKGYDAADWPQWRGPDRNGIAPASPKLLERWPTNGPSLLWKSEPIPSGTEGGCGSVTIAGGKAFVFVHWKHKGKANIVITTQMLTDLGWMEGVPDDLAGKIEDAWRAKTVKYFNPRKRENKVRTMAGEELETHIKAFLATLTPDEAAKYGLAIQQCLRNTAFDWNTLAAMAAVRGQEFASWDDLLKKFGGFIFAGDDTYNAFRDRLLGQGYHYTETIVCLDADTGKTVWKKEFPGAIPTPGMMMYIGASSTPAVWKNKCYVTGSAGFYCLSVEDGAVVWQAKTKFSNSSPMVHNGVVYCFVPRLMAFDANTGKVLWISEETLHSEHASVVLWKSGGKDYVVGANGDDTPHPICIFCVDAITGGTVWRQTPDANGNARAYSTPAIEDDLLAMGVGADVAQGYRITPEGATRLWQIKFPDTRGASLLAFRGCVYAASGRYFSAPLRCFDLKTGGAKWTGSGDFGGNAEGASPVLADGKIIAQVKDPDAVPERGGSWSVMFKASPDKFEILGQFHSDGATCVSPSIANGKLYLRQQNAVACWDIAQH